MSVHATGSFGITGKELSDMVSKCTEQPEILEKKGGIEGIAKLVVADLAHGLSGSSSDLDMRRNYFGKNYVEGKKSPTFCQLCYDSVQDFTLLMLIVCAVVSIILEMNISDPKTGWIEGTAILGSVGIVVLVTASNDYMKEKQFKKLNAQAHDIKVSVQRGGATDEIPIAELVVGDVVWVQYGDVVPADGILIECSDMHVDESSLTGEPILIAKNLTKKPYLLSGTKIMEGSGKMLVVAVGGLSQAGIIKTLVAGASGLLMKGTAEVTKGSPNVTFSPHPDENILDHLKPGGEIKLGEATRKVAKKAPFTKTLIILDKPWEGESANHLTVTLLGEEEEEEVGSILQAKLEIVAAQIGYVGTFIASLCVVYMLIRWAVEELRVTGWQNEYGVKILNYIVTGITILVVAVPEGLPLAVTLSLAFSTIQMLKDQNLVKHLDACETMGSATTICSDKTGTLTTNRMTVMKFFVADKVHDNTAKCFKGPLLEILTHGIALNSGATSRVEKAANGAPPAYHGNKTECALLKLLLDLDEDADRIRQLPHYNYPTGLKAFPFNSAIKRMSIIVNNTTKTKRRIYTKGASEVILALCNTYLNDSGSAVELSNQRKAEIEKDVIYNFADDGLRTLCLAYRDLDDDEDIGSDQLGLEVNMTLVGIFGIEDPVRDEVPAAIKTCNKAGILVRMVTGDNLHTALAIAHKCGILPRDQRDHYIAMEGPEFRNKVTDEFGNIKQDEFDKIWPRLRVLARSQPKDKYILVSGLLSSNLHQKKLEGTLNSIDGMYVTHDKQVVAVTGDGTNDAPALAKADVGFAMGIVGTQVAKEACDIILLDDNFSSIVKACIWGRNIYDGIGKFLQFQLTVNVVAIFIAALGALVLNDSPLRAVQMLWVNLIMDSLASLALATEPPTTSLLDREPYGRNDPVLSRKMVKHIACMGCYQLIVMLVLIFSLDSIMGIESGRPSVNASGEHSSEKMTVHYTMVFHSFVMMTLFNEVNSRKLHDERNVFEGLFSNKLFLLIIIATLIGQGIIVEFGGAAVSTVPLTAVQFLICVGIGLTTFPIRLLITFIPDRLFPKLASGKPEPKKVAEEEGDIARTTTMLDAKAGARIEHSNAMFAASPSNAKWRQTIAKGGPMDNQVRNGARLTPMNED